MRKILGFLACLLMLITAGNVLAAGYTCPTYKKYTSCKSGYYISNCPTSSSSWTGQTISSSSLTTGNSCKACPTNYTCTGGLVCPKANTVKVTYNLNGGSGTTPTSKVCTYGVDVRMGSHVHYKVVPRQVFIARGMYLKVGLRIRVLQQVQPL